jgi:hypothetical protein
MKGVKSANGTRIWEFGGAQNNLNDDVIRAFSPGAQLVSD